MIWHQHGIMGAMKSRLLSVFASPYIFEIFFAGMWASTITHTWDIRIAGVLIPPFVAWVILSSLVGFLLVMIAPGIRRVTKVEEDKTFIDWYREGVSKGYCSEGFCCTHDGPPLTEIEEAQFEDGSDPCVFGVRTYSTKKRGDV